MQLMDLSSKKVFIIKFSVHSRKETSNTIHYLFSGHFGGAIDNPVFS